MAGTQILTKSPRWDRVGARFVQKCQSGTKVANVCFWYPNRQDWCFFQRNFEIIKLIATPARLKIMTGQMMPSTTGPPEPTTAGALQNQRNFPVSFVQNHQNLQNFLLFFAQNHKNRILPKTIKIASISIIV